MARQFFRRTQGRDKQGQLGMVLQGADRRGPQGADCRGPQGADCRGLRGAADCRGLRGAADCRGLLRAADCRGLRGAADCRRLLRAADCRGLQAADCRGLQRAADCRGLQGADYRLQEEGTLLEVDMLPRLYRKGVGHPAARWRDEGEGPVEVAWGKLLDKVLGCHSFAEQQQQW